MECVPLYSIHCATHFQFNKTFPSTYFVPSTVLGARDKKLKAVLPELVLLLGDGCEKELPPRTKTCMWMFTAAHS